MQNFHQGERAPSCHVTKKFPRFAQAPEKFLTGQAHQQQELSSSTHTHLGGGWFTDSTSGPVPLSHFGSAPPHLPPFQDLQGLKPSSFSPLPPLQHVAPTTSFSKAQFFVSNGPATTLETQNFNFGGAPEVPFQPITPEMTQNFDFGGSRSAFSAHNT